MRKGTIIRLLAAILYNTKTKAKSLHETRATRQAFKVSFSSTKQSTISSGQKGKQGLLKGAGIDEKKNGVDIHKRLFFDGR